MLKPHRRDLKYYLKEKLCNNMILLIFNWYGLDNLINDIKKYTVDFNGLKQEEIFKD